MNDKKTYQPSYRVLNRYGHLAASERLSFRLDNVAGGVYSVFSSYTRLTALLAEGWEIEPPVYLSPRWNIHSRSRIEDTYHFILWDKNSLKLVSLLDSLELQQFITDNNLTVDKL
jgi:hypothetical protein